MHIGAFRAQLDRLGVVRLGGGWIGEGLEGCATLRAQLLIQHFRKRRYNRFWRIMAWSFLALYEGTWPLTQWNGRPWPAGSFQARKAGSPLAGGYFGVLWALKGDLDYFFSCMDMPNPGCNEPCIFCPADCSVALNWKNMSPTAPWVPLTHDPHSFLQRFSDVNILFLLVPGVTVYTIACDLMHTKYLGCDQYCMGSVLWLLVYRILGGAPKENLARLEHEMKQAFNTAEAGYNHLTLGMICSVASPSNSMPCLKGKAGEIKKFGKVLLHLWEMHMDHSRTHKEIRLVLRLTVRMNDIIDRNAGRFTLPAADANDFKKTTEQYCMLYSKIAKDYARQGMYLFPLTIKFHYMLHIAARSKFINPRLTWCFMGEDFMNHVRTLTAACVVGTGKELVSRKIVFRVSKALHHQLSQI